MNGDEPGLVASSARHSAEVSKSWATLSLTIRGGEGYTGLTLQSLQGRISHHFRSNRPPADHRNHHRPDPQPPETPQAQAPFHP